MAINATVFKITLQIADMDRYYYADHALTMARHPSETDERMMVRLLAFGLFAEEGMAFGKGLSNDEEPESSIILNISRLLGFDKYKVLFSGDLSIELAAEDINAAGGALGKPVRIISHSTNGAPEAGRLLAERMIIELYSHVMHIVSNVEGTLDTKRADMVDAGGLLTKYLPEERL